MSVSVAALPAKTLQKLKDGPTVCIQRRRTATSEPEILYTFFPKAVATAFSSRWSALFPPVNQIAVGQLSQAHPPTLTIVGGDLGSTKVVLGWMLSCCTGQGLKELQHIPRSNKPFFQYYMLKEVAEIIGCSYLEKKLGERMDVLAKTQIHSEDVRALYLALPADHDMRKFLAQHVALLLWNGELKARTAYETLREEIPDFDKDINAVLDPLVAERREKNKAEREQHYQKLREERKAQHKKQGQSKLPKKDAKMEDQKPEEVEEVTSPVKKVVPGAEDHSQVPYYKNKAAKRRHKKREEKAAEVAD